MMARLLAPALTVAACYAVWSAYAHLTILRGSVLWDLRYVVLGVAGILILSLAEWVAKKTASRINSSTK